MQIRAPGVNYKNTQQELLVDGTRKLCVLAWQSTGQKYVVRFSKFLM